MCFCEGHETISPESFGVDGYTFHRGCVNELVREVIKAQVKAKEYIINITATKGIEAYVKH